MILLVITAVLAGLAVLSIVLALGSLLNTDPQIDSRLATYVSAQNYSVAVAPHSSDQEQQHELMERLDRQLARTSFAEKLQRTMTRAGLPLTPSEYVLLRLGAVLLPTMLALVLTGSPISGAVAALLGLVLPLLWMRRREKRRLQQLQEQIPELLNVLINAMRAGLSLNQGLATVAEQASEPIAGEMRRVAQELQLGLSIEDALNNLARRIESQDLEIIIAVIRIHARVGGNLVRILETISTTIRERSRLRRDIRVITSQQRFSSYVLALLPVFLALILLLINPAYLMPLFAPGWLLCIPAGAVICNLMGFFIIQRIIKIEV